MKVKFYGQLVDYGRWLSLVPMSVRDDGEHQVRVVEKEHPIGDNVLQGNEDWLMMLSRAEAEQLRDLLDKHLKEMAK
jgi:hypothetical protein